MTPLETKLQSVLDEMHSILSNAVGPNDRREYMRTNNIHGDINWSFSLTPTDIINHRIPSNVIGCTGRAKLFCYLAGKYGIECKVVAMAIISDWRREYDASHGITPKDSRIVINGHQIISIDTPDGPRMFDPARRRLKLLPDETQTGRFVDVGYPYEFIICAIVPGDKFISLSSYWELDDMYRGKKPKQQN